MLAYRCLQYKQRTRQMKADFLQQAQAFSLFLALARPLYLFLSLSLPLSRSRFLSPPNTSEIAPSESMRVYLACLAKEQQCLSNKFMSPSCHCSRRKGSRSHNDDAQRCDDGSQPQLVPKQVTLTACTISLAPIVADSTFNSHRTSR